MAYRVGVDIGGSFTDFAVLEENTNKIRSLKVLSRPDEPGAEVMQGLRLLHEHHGINPAEILYFTHGTTVGVNSVIQRNGLRLALFTTKGFSDVLELGRLKCPDMYSLLSRRPPPLIPRELVFGISGRLRADGTVETELDTQSVRDAACAAVVAGAEGIVVSLLHAYRNPEHELSTQAAIAEIAPHLPVFCSSETWPIIREYERTITATIGAYVQPRVSNYLSKLQAALVSAGVEAEPHLTKSNGGVMTAEQGKRDCVQMILSGTASGVIGAGYISRAAKIDRCVSLDVGGTSADVAIIIDGEPQFGAGETIGDYQIYIPSVSVTSIGEGGGSIAWVDSLGILKVGPESAGSTPGPACYSRGGTRATLTDAVVACGLIGQKELGYNSVQLDVEKAREAIGVLAEPLRRSIEETADAIIRITISGMFSNVSGLLSRFGIDPREFSILAFGGAGPMLACLLARELGIKEVLVPTTPGVLSALGGLVGEIKNDFIATIYSDLAPGTEHAIRDEFARLRRNATAWLEKDQGHTGLSSLAYAAEMRYRGQSFELETKLHESSIESGDLAAIAAAFHAEHNRVYGHFDPKAPIQIIALRLVISGHGPKPELPRAPAATTPAAPSGSGTARLDGQSVDLSLYRRADLRFGHTFSGPAVIAQDDCTTVVPPGFDVAVDLFGNLRIRQGAK